MTYFYCLHTNTTWNKINCRQVDQSLQGESSWNDFLNYFHTTTTHTPRSGKPITCTTMVDSISTDGKRFLLLQERKHHQIKTEQDWWLYRWFVFLLIVTWHFEKTKTNFILITVASFLCVDNTLHLLLPSFFLRMSSCFGHIFTNKPVKLQNV